MWFAEEHVNHASPAAASFTTSRPQLSRTSGRINLTLFNFISDSYVGPEIVFEKKQNNWDHSAICLTAELSGCEYKMSRLLKEQAFSLRMWSWLGTCVSSQALLMFIYCKSYCPRDIQQDYCILHFFLISCSPTIYIYNSMLSHI